MQLHHVQLSCPAGGEEGARRFWVEGMGLVEVAKPPVLAARGGAWFRGEAVEVHVGVEEPFVPARRAHPALLLDDPEELARTAERLRDLGFEVAAELGTDRRTVVRARGSRRGAALARCATSTVRPSGSSRR